MEPDKTIWLLLANFANKTSQTLKGQVVASALISPTYLVRNTLTAQEVLGMVEKRPTTDRKNSEALRFSYALSSTTPRMETKDLLGTLRLDYSQAEC